MSVNLVQFVTICILLLVILVNVIYIARLLTAFAKEFVDFISIDEEEEDEE